MDTTRYRFNLMCEAMMGSGLIEPWRDDWWHAHAPEPEPPYPDSPDGWEELDEDDVPHWDTPGGF